MSDADINSVSKRLAEASRTACAQLGISQVPSARLEDALSSALLPAKLLDNLAEAWRTTPLQVKEILEAHGFAGVLARAQVASIAATGADETLGPPFLSGPVLELAKGQIRVRALGPQFNEQQAAPKSTLDALSTVRDAFLSNAAADVLGALYRVAPLEYVERWLATDAVRIDSYIRQHFGPHGPRYLVNSGIGANEQFNYFVAAIANARADRRTTWLLANSPRAVPGLPGDATIENTLFMEFSRSGITEETVKLHELTPAAARRIVFANSGPLKALAERDGNLLLELPSEVSGRYGRNKTPILMAPMHVAGLDVRRYWEIIQDACDAMPLTSATSAPVVLAHYIRLHQLRRGVNHIYLGTNDDLLRYSADELCQYWNEGVNREGNDISMSRYLGLPRDSHMNLEAILGTSERKMAIFLISTRQNQLLSSHSLLLRAANSIDPVHKGLAPEQVDLILALANVKRCSEKMPTLLITVDPVDLAASAWLGQIWADMTLVYSRLIGVDPGSNPEVKAVRTRAAQWLADSSAAFSLLS